MSIGSLAREIGVDPDEMLVRLWDSGFDQFDEPSDSLGGAELKQVLRALGLPGYKDLRSSGQWLDRLGVPAERVQKILAAAGLRWRRGMRVLPVGAPWALHEFEAQTADTDAPERGAHLTCEQPAQSFPEPVGQSVEWPAIGTVRDPVRYLTVGEVLGIRRQIALEFADSGDPFFETGTHNAALLESALSRPQTALHGESKYPTVEMAAAALLHSLVLNHPFHDGNKRTALVSTLVFLDENGFLITCADTDLFKFVLQVAKHSLVAAQGPERSDVEVLAAAQWIARCSRQMERGERPMKWVRLKRILRSFGCDFSHPTVGNRLNIDRDVQEPTFFGMANRSRHLHTQVQCAGDGTEADKNTVALIRREMHLDEAHGIDSRIFYDDDGGAVDDFIQLYRKTLQRLAKM
jgi:death-on-curing family protein